MKNTQYMLVAAALLVLPGCASKKPRPVIPGPAQAVVQVIPPQGRMQPKVATVNDKSVPIYQNPVIEEVEMAPYINDEGNLVMPGKMLVVKQPGRWNLDAARKSQQYYIPADNQPPQLLPPSMSYYDYIQTKKDGKASAKLDVSAVRVTGLTQKEDEAAAKALLQPGETLAYDAYLGWLAVPNKLLGAVPANQPAPESHAPVQATPAAPTDQRMESTLIAPPQPTPVQSSGLLPSAQPGPGTVPTVVPLPPEFGNPPPQGAPVAPDAAGSKEDQMRQIIDKAFNQAEQAKPAPAPAPAPSQPTTPGK